MLYQGMCKFVKLYSGYHCLSSCVRELEDFLVLQSWRENVSFLCRSQIMFPLCLHVLFPARFFGLFWPLHCEPGFPVLKA